ncbi:MAG: histidine phosphatase family protein [Pseudomonadales bacterium]
MSMLYVATHAEATHHVEHRVGGWHDSELTPRGREQAERMASALRRVLAPDTPVYTSDLRRTMQTAEPIARAFATVPQPSPDLREMSCGVAEGRPSSWLEARIVMPPTEGNRLDHRICDGAETRREVAMRVYRFMRGLLEALPPSAVIVTHGGALTYVVSAWLGVPIEALGRVRYGATAGSLTRLEFDPEWGDRKLVSLNETTHL